MKAKLNASKWLKLQLLLDPSEMQTLQEQISDAQLYNCSDVLGSEDGQIDWKRFQEIYQAYVEALKQGETPDHSKVRACFSALLSGDHEAVTYFDVSGGRRLLRPIAPVVQFQHHRVHYSTVDDTFHPMVHGPDTIDWGIQMAFPQLFLQDDGAVVETLKSGSVNAQLFRSIQRWVRKATVPCPFFIGDKKVTATIRIGHACFDWINNHPQLKIKGLLVRK